MQGQYVETRNITMAIATCKLCVWAHQRGDVVCRWNATCTLGCAVRAGMHDARWDARFTLGCMVHAGMRGARWDAWFTLACVVCAGMRSARWVVRLGCTATFIIVHAPSETSLVGCH